MLHMSHLHVSWHMCMAPAWSGPGLRVVAFPYELGCVSSFRRRVSCPMRFMLVLMFPGRSFFFLCLLVLPFSFSAPGKAFVAFWGNFRLAGYDLGFFWSCVFLFCCLSLFQNDSPFGKRFCRFNSLWVMNIFFSRSFWFLSDAHFDL